jgi:hypothetical protein
VDRFEFVTLSPQNGQHNLTIILQHIERMEHDISADSLQEFLVKYRGLTGQIEQVIALYISEYDAIHAQINLLQAVSSSSSSKTGRRQKKK